jgi:hypothetical protein
MLAVFYKSWYQVIVSTSGIKKNAHFHYYLAYGLNENKANHGSAGGSGDIGVTRGRGDQ